MSISPNPAAGRNDTLLLGSMSLAIFLTVTAVAMPGPLLVDLSIALDTTVPVAGQLITIAAATWGLTAIIVGPFSDTYGRKPILLLGTCLLSTGAFGIGLAPSLTVAMGFSVLVGMGGGMVPPTCIALAGDAFTDRRRPMSIAILTAAPGMSSLLGVPLAAILGDFAGWRFSFFTIGSALALSTLLLLALVPNHRPQKARLDLISRLRWVATFPVPWYIAGANIMARIAWGVIITFLPVFLIVTYNLEIAEVALPIGIVALGTTAAPLIGGRIGRARRRLPITAALLLSATIPGAGIFLLSWGLWFSVAIAGLYMLLIVPVTTVLSILCAETGGDSRGTLAGVISSSNWGGAAAGAAIGGLLVAQINYGALSFLLAGIILGSGLLMAFLVTGTAAVRARERFSKTPEEDATNSGRVGD